ncbi:MAG: hypothetical protein WCP96_09055 [Methylococcaceae bacterium]
MTLCFYTHAKNDYPLNPGALISNMHLRHPKVRHTSIHAGVG